MPAPIVVLGIDVSPKRLGWGLVTLDDGAAVACGMEPIDLPDAGWMEQQVTEALKALPDCHVAAVFIEQPALPPVSGTKSAFNAGRAVQVTHTVVRRRWPEAPVEYLQPAEWAKLAGLTGKPSKQDKRDAAFAFASDCGASWQESQDAADALLVARAGQRRNVDSWDRAVARGAT